MMVLILQIALIVAAAILITAFVKNTAGKARTPTLLSLPIGAVANFFDTLGIGSFAPTTAAIKFFRITSDDKIPATLNVGYALPTVLEALIFIAVVGGVLGARIVSRLPVNAIRLGMGVALLAAAALFAMKNLGLMPGGGAALSLGPAAFALACALFFFYGAIMMLGVGLYAPALITLSLLGMDPRAAFPIMMGACAFLMPASSLQFIASGRFDPRIVAGFALGGLPGVAIAAFIVKEMPLDTLRWLVTGVVLFAAVTMIASVRGKDESDPAREGA